VKPYYEDPWLTIHAGDCRDVLAALPDESVHCVVTSPPYWGLRDYGTAAWDGGDPACDHVRQSTASRASSGLGVKNGKGPYGDQFAATQGGAMAYGAVCGKCGARRVDSQLGLEPTPEEYVANMVAVFREVRRVLRRDGTCWLNLGDSYAGGSQTDGNVRWEGAKPGNAAGVGARDKRNRDGVGRVPGLKPKDLVGIPWRVAFALQADGWYLRSEVIWSKSNPMPESVTDRPTKSHEQVFLLTRSPRYFYDADAVRETSTERDHNERYERNGRRLNVDRGDLGDGNFPSPAAGRNLRSVWQIATQPYPGAHFATFPEKLVEPCIKAGTSEKGVCPECGAPWVRVVERSGVANDANEVIGDYDVPGLAKGSSADRVRRLSGATYQRVVSPTDRWRPSCAHDAAPVPATICDPFGGSGTTARVANRLSRRAILVDLNGEYLVQQLERNRDIPLGLGAA
jgi:DNA modification methylase